MATKKKVAGKTKPKTADPVALLKEIEQTREKLRGLEKQVDGTLDSSIKAVAEDLVKNLKINWKTLQQLVFEKGLREYIYEDSNKPEEVKLMLHLCSGGDWEVKDLDGGTTLTEGKL